MGTRRRRLSPRLTAAGVALAVSLSASACGNQAPLEAPVRSAPTTAPSHLTYPVGLRVLWLSRGPLRPLPTLVFYPATPFASVTAGGSDTRPAAGRFPLVLFSHGLRGAPERYAAALRGWAAAGFVVAAPTYPYTSEYAKHFRRSDIVHQSDDARYVLDQLRQLDAADGDPLAGHLDAEHIAAVGHSAGGYTTTGLFTAGHDPRLRAGVIMAGWLAPGAFAGPPAAMLFLQGSADPVVPVALSRRAFDRVPWPKTYVLMPRNSHTTYLHPDGIGYAQMESTVINFLRWTLNGDLDARRQLPHSSIAR